MTKSHQIGDKFPFMEEWKEYKIGDICSKVCSGGTPSSKRSDYYDGEIPWLNTKEINFNRIYNTEKNITEDGLNNSSAKWIEANSVIVAMYGATAGKSAIAKIPLTTNQACCNLTINTDVADYRFVYYFLCKKFFELASLANGGAQQNLNAQIIKDFGINMPSLSEQIRIADVLSTIDDKIELNRRINDNLEQQAQALFKSWFVDFEPFKDGEFVESELGKIPKGWRVGNLGEFMETTSGGTPSRKIENYYKNGTFCWIKSKELINGFIYDTEEKITEEAIKKSSAKLLPKHSILIAMYGATVGEFGIISYPMTCNQAICALIPNANVPYSVLYLFALNNKINLQNKAVGSAQQNISQVIIKGLGFLYNEKVFKEFNGIVEPMLKQIEKNTIEIIHLSKLRDILLPQLMSGNLQVDELSL